MAITPVGLMAVGAAYLIGSIPFGLLIGRLHGLDIRAHGSGNIGATNVTRVIGRDWGRLCFVLDFCKGLGPVVAANFAFAHSTALVPCLVAAATVVGHVWPLYLRFKGGKGVATSIGALIALALWQVLLAALAWYLVFRLTRYVSVASIAAAIVLPLSTTVIDSAPATIVLLTGIAMLVLVRHRDNMIRLLEGREHRFIRNEGSS